MQENQIDETLPADDYQMMIVAGSKEKASKGLSSNRSLFMIPPSKIKPMPGFNARVKNARYWEKAQEFADSIEENGFYTDKPIGCIVIKQDGEDVIVYDDGHRRMDAIEILRKKGVIVELVPCVIKPASNLTDMTVRLVTANSGEQLTPMEIAIVCKRLHGYGLDNATIAKRLAFSIAYVGQLLALTAAPQQIIDMVNDDKISATLAVTVLKEEGEKAVKVLQEAVQTAKDSGKGKATAKHIKTSKAPATPATVKPTETPDIPVQQEVKDSSPVLPLMPTASVTPFDALVISEAVYKAETAMQESGIEWLKQNVGIVDDSHYELICAMTGTEMETLRGMLE